MLVIACGGYAQYYETKQEELRVAAAQETQRKQQEAMELAQREAKEKMEALEREARERQEALEREARERQEALEREARERQEALEQQEREDQITMSYFRGTLKDFVLKSRCSNAADCTFGSGMRYVTGTFSNQSGRNINSVRVTVGFLDDDGNLRGTGSDFIGSLVPGEKWQFSVDCPGSDVLACWQGKLREVTGSPESP